MTLNLLRPTADDEHKTQFYHHRGIHYAHVEHARWAELWRCLNLDAEYASNRHQIRLRRIGLSDKRTRPGSPKYKGDGGQLCYRPHFYLRKLDIFVDIKTTEPNEDSIASAIDMFRTTQIPVAMIQSPMFVPNRRTLSPRIYWIRESLSPRPYYLQYDNKVTIGQLRNNEPAICHYHLQAAFTDAVMVGYV